MIEKEREDKKTANFYVPQSMNTISHSVINNNSERRNFFQCNKLQQIITNDYSNKIPTDQMDSMDTSNQFTIYLFIQNELNARFNNHFTIKLTQHLKSVMLDARSIECKAY